MSDLTPETIQGRYNGEGKPLFWLALKTTALTILTLGIYRFWAKTRIRRYIWSATAPGGDTFEYTGTGVEKLIGFLIAIVVLAVYLGITQVFLMFFGFSLMDMATGPDATAAETLAGALVTYITLLALTPLIFFARYRARRYMLSRTRWRGLRFAMDKAAFQYAWRGVLYFLFTVISLGLLWPLMTFNLEKFKTDRTWYGDAKFEQGGKWTMLYPAMKHLFIGVAIAVVGSGIGIAADVPVVFGVSFFVGYIWGAIGFVHYRTQSFAIMARHKTLDGEIAFKAAPQTSEVVIKYILGGLLVGLVFAVLFAPVVFATSYAFSSNDMELLIGAQIFIILGYLLSLILSGAVAIAFISQPILRHFVETSTALNPAHFDTIRQRIGDDMADAEGFADALDIGGAF